MAEGPQPSESFYEIVDGAIYDKALLEAVEEFTKNVDISYEDAKTLWSRVGEETGTISEVDVRTVEYILKKHKFEKFASIFLKEAIKLEKQEQKGKAKEEEVRKKQELKAAGMSPVVKPKQRKSLGGSPGRSPGKSAKKKRAGAKEDEYKAIERITEELASATSLSKVKTLQRQLEQLTPKKVDLAEALLASPVRKQRIAKTEVTLSSPLKGRGRGKSAEASSSKGRGRGKMKKLSVARQSALPLISISPTNGKKANDSKGSNVASRKRPAASEAAPTTPPRKGGKQQECEDDGDESEDEDEDDDEEDDGDEEEESEEEEEEEPRKASKAKPPMFPKPRVPLKVNLKMLKRPANKVKASGATGKPILKRPASQATSKGAGHSKSKDAKSSAAPALKRPAMALPKKIAKPRPEDAVDVD